WRDCYAGSWVAQRAVDMPVEDAMRRWRKWTGDAGLVDRLEEAEDRLALRDRVEQALKQARLLGGAVIFIGTNRSVLTAPLQPTEQVRFLNIVDGCDVSIPPRATRHNPLLESADPDILEIHGERVHRSRLALFRGCHCS